jgi:uncharacterized paraquat-inducible protein A
MVRKIKYFFLKRVFRKEYKTFQSQLQDFSAAFRSSRILREHYPLPKGCRFAYNHESWVTCPGCQEIYDARSESARCPHCKTKLF